MFAALESCMCTTIYLGTYISNVRNQKASCKMLLETSKLIIVNINNVFKGTSVFVFALVFPSPVDRNASAIQSRKTALKNLNVTHLTTLTLTYFMRLKNW